jgi:uncharacterized iron-regulated membrane protein
MPIERLLKSLHSWLGVLVLPWVIVAGLTGLYMNHEELVLSVFPDRDLGADRFRSGGTAQTEASARALAEGLFGAVGPVRDKTYEGRPTFSFKQGDRVEVLVDRATGHLWYASGYAVTLYAPDGQVLAQRLRWGRVLSSLHRRGWVGGDLGTWLADITAVALMVFGSSGLVLFFAPRVRRWKNRRARLAHQRRVAASPPASPCASPPATGSAGTGR